MNSSSGFQKAALAVAVTLAFGSTGAFAVTAPSSTQLPGKGSIVSGHVAVGGIVSGQQTITIGNAGDQAPANAVINWGSGSTINAGGIGGFNIGSKAALTFADGTGNASGAAVLNVDNSGNPSQIFGKLTGNGTSVFVANSNGIVVGSAASISSTAGVGLIANNTLAGTGSDFNGGSSISYTGSGGDVTVPRGASISGTSVLIAGGGTVNVSLSALKGPTGSASLNAGVASAGSGGTDNPNASLAVVSALPSGVSLGGFNSAGTAFNNGGTLVLGAYRVDGLFTNTGFLTLPATNGAVYNKGQLTTKVAASFTSLSNDGSYSARDLAVTGGNLVNNGKLWAPNIVVTDGNIVNNGTMLGVYNISTASDANRVQGSDYSITNTGTLNSYSDLQIDANRSSRAAPLPNNTTGSFINTGTLQLAQAAKLTIKARNDISVGGLVQTGVGTSAADTSPTNPIGMLVLSASGFNAAGARSTGTDPVFWTNSTLSILTPISVVGAILHGRQVKVMSSISSVAVGKPNGTVTIVGGPALTGDYSITIGDGAVVSAKSISIVGSTLDKRPNLYLGGTLSAATLGLGGSSLPLTDLFSGPNGSVIATGTAPSVLISFSGDVGLASAFADSNFRLNYLPISAPSGTLTLRLKPLDYTAYGSSVNLLVNGNVNLVPPPYVNSPAIYGNGTASGPTSIPNSHLVVQSSGNIATNTGYFYWPGYVYLGNISRNADGSAAPGTLGGGTITLGGKFSNVLPGSTSSDGGIEFITAKPLNMGSYNVTTNANSLISFGTTALTQQYASGALGSGQFYGGKQGSGTAVNYGKLDPSMFSTDAPVATP